MIFDPHTACTRADSRSAHAARWQLLCTRLGLDPHTATVDDALQALIERQSELTDAELGCARAWQQLTGRLGIPLATHPGYLVGEGALAENARLRTALHEADTELAATLIGMTATDAIRRSRRIIELALMV